MCSRSSLCGWRKRLWQCWCDWWGSIGGSEPERPSRVSSLTTGRTPEPLNPDLHSVRSIAPWDSSRGGFNSPGVLVGPSPPARAELCMTTPLLPPASIRTINTVQRGCLCVPASSGVYGSLTHSCWARSQWPGSKQALALPHMPTFLRHQKTPALTYIKFVCTDKTRDSD